MNKEGEKYSGNIVMGKCSQERSVGWNVQGNVCEAWPDTVPGWNKKKLVTLVYVRLFETKIPKLNSQVFRPTLQSGTTI